MAKNKFAKGIKSTKSGLQYKILKQSNGAQPNKNDRVKVHYSGSLINGTIFDSSYKRGAPAEFALTRVIPGWTEGLQLMRIGSKFRFFIPSKIAYGAKGQGPLIGPHATLIFEVELLEIL